MNSLAFGMYNCSCSIERLICLFSLLQGVPEQKLRSHLGSLGVSGSLALQPMYTLSGKHYLLSYHCFIHKIEIYYFEFLVNLFFLTASGGQKSRVAFAKITFKKPHIILLDEPSNHLVSSFISSIINRLTFFHFSFAFLHVLNSFFVVFLLRLFPKVD